MNRLDICILCIILTLRAIWSFKHPISKCHFDRSHLERPFIYATSKSPDDIVQITAGNGSKSTTDDKILNDSDRKGFNNNKTYLKKYISPLTVHQKKGNFTLADENPAYCKVPKDGVYAVFLQVNVQQISSNVNSVTHAIGVSKVTVNEQLHIVRQFAVAKRYLSTTFTGPAFCANLTALAKNDLLVVIFDSYIQLEFETALNPIQLIVYMVSPNLEAV